MKDIPSITPRIIPVLGEISPTDLVFTKKMATREPAPNIALAAKNCPVVNSSPNGGRRVPGKASSTFLGD